MSIDYGLDQTVEEQLKIGYNGFMLKFNEEPGAIIMAPDMLKLLFKELEKHLGRDAIHAGPRFRNIPIITRPEMPMTGAIIARVAEFQAPEMIDVYHTHTPKELTNGENEFIAALVMSHLIAHGPVPKPVFPGSP